MGDAERWWVIAAGVLGLVLFAGGLVAARPPRVEDPLDEVVANLLTRRSSVLAGSLATITGTSLLLWPLVSIATDAGTDAWRSLALASVAAWLLGSSAGASTARHRLPTGDGRGSLAVVEPLQVDEFEVAAADTVLSHSGLEVRSEQHQLGVCGADPEFLPHSLEA